MSSHFDKIISLNNSLCSAKISPLIIYIINGEIFQCLSKVIIIDCLCDCQTC